jgi:glycerol-3-phosphate cytidylyltransferase
MRAANGRPDASGRVIGYAAGAYDLFHVGHLNLLRNARANCDYLIAGVVSDELSALRKGKRPIVPLAERLEIVRNLRCVDEAVAEQTPHRTEQWERYPFDVFFKGDDWAGTMAGAALEAEFSALGVRVFYLPYTATTSSTILRRALDALSADVAS